ncbi:transmembrane amino acid transporter protein-domain-containing protein [Aspergillus pseudoustus]|uniref:Transmembrane amino acid transporter protein-domain-containing protein n=1 Tax=Aspergillus pseudoustus TaxID=1810923 RepID=A0ABR4JJ41_9EURO
MDFASIVLLSGSSGGLSAVNWSAWPKDNLTFTDAFMALPNISFAYSFAMVQFSFMDEMHTPQVFPKPIWTLGLTEIIIYTLTGALIYAFIGQDVQSPALLSAGDVLSRVAFGIALPVIFISGSINTVVFARLIHWPLICQFASMIPATLVSFVIADLIPFFNNLLSLSSALFISGFTYYFPALMWFILLRKGGCSDRKNIHLTFVNSAVFVIGLIILVRGTYSSVRDDISKYKSGTVRGVFTCSLPA